MSQIIQDTRGRGWLALCWSFFLLLLVCHGPLPDVYATGLPLASPYEVKGVEYDQSIPTIEQVTGIETGLRHTSPYQIIEYFKAAADASDRVSLVEYGRTYEGIPLICAAVTSPANQANLETIRENNLKLSEQPEIMDPNIIRNMPLVVYIGSGIHGNEASGGEASMLLLYHLAAGQGSGLTIRRWRFAWQQA